MKIPFCDFCAKNRIPCPKCKELIDTGLNDLLDLSVSKILLEESSRIRELDQAEFRKAYREDDFLMILTNNEGVRIIRTADTLIKRLNSETGCEKVIVVDYRKDQKRKLEELLYPYRVISISKIWLPGNITEFRVTLEGRDLDEKRVQTLQKLAQKLGINVRIHTNRG
ncbi:MAG: hypothetical protein ACUVQ0_01100 [Thermoproteota archaeon]